MARTASYAFWLFVGAVLSPFLQRALFGGRLESPECQPADASKDSGATHSGPLANAVAFQSDVWRFVRYVPSDWEAEWTAYVGSDTFKSKKPESFPACSHLKSAGQPERAEETLRLLSELMPGTSEWNLAKWKDKGPKRAASLDLSKKGDSFQPETASIWTKDTKPHPLLSKLVYSVLDSSGKRRTEVASFIEPLIGHLRHPYHCIARLPKCHLDTSYLLLDRRSRILREKSNGLQPPAPFTTLYFDLGATLFPAEFPNTESWGSSQGFFPGIFAKLGLSFDSMSLWEIVQHSADEIFKNVPADVLAGYQFFNVPVATMKDKEWNAIQVLKGKLRTMERQFASARESEGIRRSPDFKSPRSGVSGSPEIYVVFKLDIDSSAPENGVVKRLLELLPGGTNDDPAEAVEVHEFFFEHHTNIRDVQGPGWCKTKDCPTLEKSYALFRSLRERGVRAHSWI